MEAVHGVDVSWLHHPQKDHHSQKALLNSPNDKAQAISNQAPQANDDKPDTHMTAKPNHLSLHRPHLLSRHSEESTLPQSQAIPKGAKDIKPAPPSPTAVRRGSWISNISSKFSSSANQQYNSQNGATSVSVKPLPSPQKEQPNPINGTVTSAAKDIKRPEISVQQTSYSPKSGSPSFIQSALRRLSSSNSIGLGKVAGTGAMCQRRVMNVDPYRERCQIEDLQPGKLRRVAFSVDVEIAATARYNEEDSDEVLPPSLERRPSLTQLERQLEIQKKKEKKLKEKSEGAALKNPQVVVEKTEHSAEGVSVDEAAVESLPEHAKPEDSKDSSRKKEKKKKSEEERKHRKERKKEEAVANGTIPVELARDNSSHSESSTEGSSPTRIQDRRTTDPLRIYRRCCQLRETPVLKNITDQLSLPDLCNPSTPGTISCLDLSGYQMQLQDTITLGDYLAVVPIKKLMLEDCGLTDEALRVILAGLLAAKTPEQVKHNKRLSKKSKGHIKEHAEQYCVIEKLCLKNNPKIGKDGWKYIGLFIYMSKSIKAIDLSNIPFSKSTPAAHRSGSITKAMHGTKNSVDIPVLFQKCLGERLGGSRLEELVMAECDLNTEAIEQIVDGVIQCGATRLGLASNNMGKEGLQIVTRYVQTGQCEGLDLGGNDLSEDLQILAEALDSRNPLTALSLADCNLSPSSLRCLFSALVSLPNFRFVDLSHNRKLFATQPSALNLLRKFLPQFPILKRIHLQDVAMTSEHAIALAEVLPESHSLAHLNILENPQLTALASAKEEAGQQEACALYASLMAAVRVSSSLICIDIDIPTQESSEVVKALAKQVVAYSLRNMERGPIAEAYTSTAESNGHVHVPDILLHLVGHMDDVPENHDDDEPAPDDDYIVGGTGVVKALGVCLGSNTDNRRLSRDITPGGSGSATPKQAPQGTEVAKGKAKDMSKNLLASARKIRARLQPALARELREGNEMGYKRLLFLDETLRRMIQRFEDEYPECRLVPPESMLSQYTSEAKANVSALSFSNPFSRGGDVNVDETAVDEAILVDEDDAKIRAPMSRQHSDVSMARHLTEEEGQMHRFGQQMRREILRPKTSDYTHGTTGHDIEPQYLQTLRQKLEGLKGEEIRDKVGRWGSEAVLQELGLNAEEVFLLKQEDPEEFRKFREAQLAAQRNSESSSKGREEQTV